jgi:hypothetical protein
MLASCAEAHTNMARLKPTAISCHCAVSLFCFPLLSIFFFAIAVLVAVRSMACVLVESANKPSFLLLRVHVVVVSLECEPNTRDQILADYKDGKRNITCC